MRISEPSARPVVCARLEAVRQRIESWRQTRPPRTRMPDVLWASAVELAREYGLSRTARALGLGYYTLQKRLAATGPSESPAAGVQSAFVELIPVIPAGAECTVELERPGEATMRIHIKSAALPDLEALTRMFWSAQA